MISRTNREIAVRRDGKGVSSARPTKWWELELEPLDLEPQHLELMIEPL